MSVTQITNERIIELLNEADRETIESEDSQAFYIRFARKIEQEMSPTKDAEDAALFRHLVEHAWEFKTSFDKEGQPTRIKADFKITTLTSDSMGDSIRSLVHDFGKNAEALSEKLEMTATECAVGGCSKIGCEGGIYCFNADGTRKEVTEGQKEQLRDALKQFTQGNDDQRPELPAASSAGEAVG
jgi:hypothetical protein